MAYYIDKIEQVKGAEEGTINEYGSRTKQNTYDSALTAFYTSLGNVANDLVETDPTKNHYFMDIRIVDSKGGVLKKDTVGTHQNV